jgi:drug/metabolite transporter (DMT)-like permease
MAAGAIMSDNMRGAAYMMVAMAAFALGDACVKALTQVLPIYQAITLRGVLTVPALLMIAHFSGGLRLMALQGAWRLVALRSVAEVVTTLCFFVALLHMPLAVVTAILQFLPLAITLAAAAFLKEPVGWRRLSAIGAGFGGVMLIIRPGTDSFSIWALFALMAVAAVVVRDLSSRRLPAAVSSVTVALCGAVAVTLIAAALSLRSEWQPVGLSTAALITAAAAMIIVGYIFAVQAMRVGEVGFTTPFRYSGLIWATMLGWIFFAEFPDGLSILGGLIVVGSGLFTLARERRLRSEHAA